MEPKHVIVGTAGHIDHGKSTLVEALTGTHPDRLEEEKRRGITIDLGFAFLNPSTARVSALSTFRGMSGSSATCWRGPAVSIC